MLRLATFNIHAGRAKSGRLDLSRTAEAIAATGATLVALQELDKNLPRTGRVDQPKVLGDLLGMHVSFCPTVTRSGGEYGIALAATVPLDVHFESLPQRADEEPRGVIVATFEGASIFATHLAWQADVRQRHMAALAEMALQLPPPRVILGDLNAMPSRLDLLRRAGFDPGPESPPTFGRGLRRRQIDYILTQGGLNVRRCWTVESRASDHLPFAAELEASRGSVRPR